MTQKYSLFFVILNIFCIFVLSLINLNFKRMYLVTIQPKDGNRPAQVLLVKSSDIMSFVSGPIPEGCVLLIDKLDIYDCEKK